MDDYLKQKRLIELTNEQINRLEFYLRISTKYRKEELETWKELAKEKDNNGEPVYANAESNASFYENLEATIQEVLEALQSRNLKDNSNDLS